jgi:hypothetical protein
VNNVYRLNSKILRVVLIFLVVMELYRLVFDESGILFLIYCCSACAWVMTFCILYQPVAIVGACLAVGTLFPISVIMIYNADRLYQAFPELNMLNGMLFDWVFILLFFVNMVIEFAWRTLGLAKSESKQRQNLVRNVGTVSFQELGR